MTDSSQFAVDAIKEIHDLWKVQADRVQWVGDPSASSFLLEGYGFDWWPGDFKVEVRVFGPHPEIERPVYRLSVRTEYLCDVDVTTSKFRWMLSDLNREAPSFAICAHPTFMSQIVEKYGSLDEFGLDFKSSKVWLSSTAYVHEGAKWIPFFLAWLAILQPIRAQYAKEGAIRLIGGRPDSSAPPGSASPTSDDKIDKKILVFDRIEIVPQGQRQSAWIGTGEFEEIVNKWGRGDSGFGKAYEGGGLAIAIPFGDTTAIVVLKTDMPHPLLGNGLLVSLKIPCVSNFEKACEHALEMNYLEDRSWTKPGMPPLIGNWIVEEWDLDGKPGFIPVFRHFFPNLFYQRGLAEVFVVDAMSRAEWCHKLLLPNTVDLPLDETLGKETSQTKQADFAKSFKQYFAALASDKNMQVDSSRSFLTYLRNRLGRAVDRRPKSARLAVDIVRTVYNLWKVDPGRARWVGDLSPSTLLSGGYGFDWWPGDFKVEVRVCGPLPESDYPEYCLSVRTDFLRNVDVTAANFQKTVSELNRGAPTFAICTYPPAFPPGLEEKLGPLHDLKSSKVWLASTAPVHEGTRNWLPCLFAGLAILQPVESQFAADGIMRRLGGQADRSTPPGRGSPTNLDSIQGAEKDIALRGMEQSKWANTGEFEEIAEKWGRHDFGFGIAGEGHLDMEMPFGDATARLKLRTDEPHPRLGNGLRVTLTLPVWSSESDTDELTMEMNYTQQINLPNYGGPFIGSWSAENWSEFRKGDASFAPAQSFFVPNLFYQRGLAETLVVYAMARAKRLREISMPGAIDLPMYQILDKRLGVNKPR